MKFKIGDIVIDSVGLREGVVISIVNNSIYVRWENKSISIMEEDELYFPNEVPPDIAEF